MRLARPGSSRHFAPMREPSVLSQTSLFDLPGVEPEGDGGIAVSYEGADDFRQAVEAHLGADKGALTGEATLLADWIDTSLGAMIAVASETHLHLLEFANRKTLTAELKALHTKTEGGIGIGAPPPTRQVRRELEAYFRGESGAFETPLVFHGTDFEQTVWRMLQTIPLGETWSYKQLAESLGQPTATRAVARANGRNQLAIIVPCHRVIGADGSLTGYAGGLWRKEKLLRLEGGARAQL